MSQLSYRKQCSPDKLEFARSMRRKPTPTEKRLWQELQCKKLGVKFRRQSIILGYIVDFYCPSQRLIIECDGRQHGKIKDSIRDGNLIDKGFMVLRFENSRIREDMLSVLTTIRAYCPPL